MNINDDAGMVFLIISLLFGILYIIFTPPFQAPDESTHFYKAWKLSELEINPVRSGDNRWGYILPETLVHIVESSMQGVNAQRDKRIDVKKIKYLLRMKISNEQNIFHETYTLYSPVVYLPQVLGIVYGKALNLSPLLKMYLARGFNLSVWLFIMYLAIRITPAGKYLFLMLALTPMSLFMAASLSPDALTNGFSFLFIALVFRYSYNRTAFIGKKQYLLIVFLAVLVALTKTVYFMLVFLVFIIPGEKFLFSKKKVPAIKSAVLLLSVLFMLVWGYVIKDISNGITGANRAYELTFSGKINFIFSEPAGYSGIIFETMRDRGLFYLFSFIGILGSLDVFIPPLCIVLYFIALWVAAVFKYEPEISISLKDKIFMLALALCLGFSLLTMFFVLSAENNIKVISGVQGRYLIPGSLLFFIFFFRMGECKAVIKGLGLKLLLFLAAVHIFSIKAILQRYYMKG